MKAAHPHEKRVQRHAYVALAVATLLALLQATRGDAAAFGQKIPLLAGVALGVVGAIVGAVAVHRRSGALALAACGLLILALLPGALVEPGLAGYGLGLLFGLALLLYGELVHMTTRYDRAHAAVETENVPEEHLNKVTDEALKTLAVRGLLAAAFAAAGVLLAFLLGAIGPAQWRAAIETRRPLGVALATLVLLALAGLVVLARGATLRRDANPSPSPQESFSDAAE